MINALQPLPYLVIDSWHFGVDSIDEYTGKELHVTFEEGMSDLFRMEGNKQKVRAEHQES